MTAPALVALAHGSRDPRSAATIRALAGLVADMRPDLRVEPAFLELASPSHVEVIDRLASEGVEEIVVVPLLLTRAYHAQVDVPAVVEAAVRRNPGLRVRASDVLGVQPTFIDVLDKRLRTALADARVRELDGLVLAAAGSSDTLANAAVARAARAWGARHHLPTIAAFASAAPRPPVRPYGRCAPTAAATSRWARCSSHRGSCPTGPRSWRSKRAQSPSPRRSAWTRSSSGPCSRGTPSAPSTSSRSPPDADEGR
ncbi:MAG: CbiX/SirB N-terminal domain-containing protein [Nocardioidaceae bacterium]